MKSPCPGAWRSRIWVRVRVRVSVRGRPGGPGFPAADPPRTLASPGSPRGAPPPRRPIRVRVRVRIRVRIRIRVRVRGLAGGEEPFLEKLAAGFPLAQQQLGLQILQLELEVAVGRFELAIALARGVQPHLDQFCLESRDSILGLGSRRGLGLTT